MKKITSKKEISPEVLHKRELNKLTVNELIHWWCNNKIKIKEYNKRDYTFTPDKFYFNNILKAQIINKKILIITEFDNKGAYGSGISSYSIIRAFPINNIISLINSPFRLLDKEYQKQNPDIVINYLIKEILENSQNCLNLISYYKEVIENNRILGLHNLQKKDFISTNIISKLKVIFDKKLVDESLNKKVNYLTEYKKYKGWSTWNYDILQKLNHNHSINEIVNKGLNLYFNKEEIQLLKLKHFLYSYCRFYESYNDSSRRYYKRTSYSYTISLKEAKKIWFSDKKEKWKQDTITKYNAIKAEKEKEELKKKEETVKLALLKINNFRSNTGSTSNLHNLGYVVLKLVSEPFTGSRELEHIYPKIIISSLGMKIEIKEAKKALQLFRLKETKHDLVQGFKYQGIIKRNIPYLDEEKNVQYKEEDCIKIGCHVVPESEIKAFLEYYKLDW